MNVPVEKSSEDSLREGLHEDLEWLSDRAILEQEVNDKGARDQWILSICLSLVALITLDKDVKSKHEDINKWDCDYSNDKHKQDDSW